MSIWLLEAKPFSEDTRSVAATSARFWITPGTYTVGRTAIQCDIDVPEDKTISRTHAEIKVPSSEELQHSPYITITDKSKYGTYATKGNNLEQTGQVNTVLRAEHYWLLRFGYGSPFR
jgi:pSer/pThr/pTyr-binding forkhead associated (FHA) protein